MVDGRVREVENRARIFEELKDREARRKDREACRKRWGNIADAVILLVVLLGGFVGYDVWCTRREKSDVAEAEARLARIQADAERHKEEERQRAAAMLAREQEAARTKARLEAERKAKEEELARKRQELDSAREIFRSVFRTIEGGTLDFVSELKLNDAAYPLYYLFPGHMSDEHSFVVHEKDANGEERMYVLNDKGERTGIDTNMVATTLLVQDYLVVSSNKVYFHSNRKRRHTGVISKMKPSDLTDVFFGGVAKDIKTIDPDFPGLKFEIVFIPKGWKRIIISDTVEFGHGYSLSKVRESVEEAIPMKATTTVKPSRKKYKRTVAFWDGCHIKRGVDGVTYVPRVPPPERMNTYHHNGYGYWYTTTRSTSTNRRDQWETLRSQAEKQDREEAEFYESQRSVDSAKQAMQRTVEEQRYAEKIDAVMKEGELYFRALMK